MPVEEMLSKFEYNWKRSSEKEALYINKRREGASIEAHKV